jgi:hypothetical protein
MKQFLCLCVLLASFFVKAQEPVQTIKVKREQNLAKVIFDNTENRLFVIDRFGNPRSNEIVSYSLWINGKGSELKGYSNALSPEMIKELRKQKKAVKLFFTKIKVKSDDDHVIDLPDVIEVWFPDCKNCLKKE